MQRRVYDLATVAATQREVEPELDGSVSAAAAVVTRAADSAAALTFDLWAAQRRRPIGSELVTLWHAGVVGLNSVRE